MVSIRRQHSFDFRRVRLKTVLPCLVLSVVVFELVSPNGPSNYNLQLGLPTSPYTFENAIEKQLLDPNVQAMRNWRTHLGVSCQNFLANLEGNISETQLQVKENLEAEALKALSIPDPSMLSPDLNRTPYKFCKHVFIDLGTNRGDTIALAVDATLDVCSQLFFEADPTIEKKYRNSRQFPHPHLDETKLSIHGKGYKSVENFKLSSLLQKYFNRNGGSMEEACVYGMEGNPYFTRHLKNLEAFVYGMKPRPFNHLYIHTESVVAPIDGPTTLYIDQFSEKNHFWGSSLIRSVPDVIKTAKQNNGSTVSAQVQGITLSTLLRRSLLPFDPNLSPGTGRGGGSLLVKMDIEGAEYSVLKELEASGLICSYVQMGNNATLVVEYHKPMIQDPKEKEKAMEGLKEARQNLKLCGVRFHLML